MGEPRFLDRAERTRETHARGLRWLSAGHRRTKTAAIGFACRLELIYKDRPERPEGAFTLSPSSFLWFGVTRLLQSQSKPPLLRVATYAHPTIVRPRRSRIDSLGDPDSKRGRLEKAVTKANRKLPGRRHGQSEPARQQWCSRLSTQPAGAF